MHKIAVVLAAGKGTRMRSKHAKVVHAIMGKPMINWVLDALEPVGFDDIHVVVGHAADQVRACVGDTAQCVLQEEQLGTGHAVQTVMKDLTLPDGPGMVLVTCGDTPLITGEVLAQFVAYHESHGHAADVLTVINPAPTGYGRIVRNADDIVERIVEEKDANEYIRAIQETNVGTYCFDLQFLRETLFDLTTDNAQNEFYLTDLIHLAQTRGRMAGAFIMKDLEDGLGVNNRVQLAQATKVMRQRINETLMMAGITMVDPESCYIDASVRIGCDTLLEPNVILEGNTRIGEGCIIGSQTKMTNVQFGSGSVVQASTLWDCTVGEDCQIGPFAYLRPGTVLENGVKIGDFVEVKNSHIGRGSKIPHLGYVGDATFGERVNFGCGSITCNYDGHAKHQTVLGDGVFVGSNTNLVAPIEIEDNAYVGAGSTLTKNVKKDALALTRAPQKTIENWKKRT